MSSDDKYLQYFVVKPSTKLFGGIKVDKATEFEVENEKQTIKQTLKDLVLRTEIKEEREDIYKTTEHSIMTQELPEGAVLIWGEDTCYIIPNYNMVTPDEAADSLDLIRRTTNDIIRNEKEDTPVN